MEKSFASCLGRWEMQGGQKWLLPIEADQMSCFKWDSLGLGGSDG